MTFFDAIVLGIVEGLTEFLPISSTGHLILTERLLGIAQTDFLKSFNIAIQLGAILAVVVLYFRSFFDSEVVKRLIVAFIPTGIIGFTLYGFIKEHLIGNEMIVVWALFLGGVALIIFELLYREGDETVQAVPAITYKQAIFVGFFQALAIIPGVSRSAATIVGGLLTSGISRATIVEFSFLLAVPTMVAATGYDVLKNVHVFSADNATLLVIGFLTSFIVALFAMKSFLSFVKDHSFIPFGIYRIVIAILFFVFIL